MHSSQEIENEKILDQIGKRLGIKFLIVAPLDRCERAGNKLCWPHYTDDQTFKTYSKILLSLKGERVSGFIGFSNGGYFLNHLAQLKELGYPIISVGAAGKLLPSTFHNSLTLVVGKNEVTYSRTQKLFWDMRGASSLNVMLIEHEGGHILPRKELEKVIENL